MRSLRVCSLFLALASSACVSPPRALRWEVVGGEPRRAEVASWQAFVAPGACAWTNRSTTAGLDTGALDAGVLDAGASVYDRTASSLEMLAAPPELDPGRWSFHLIGRNAEGRALIAGCTTETLPLPRDSRVTVRLEPAFLAPGDDLTSIRFCAAWSELGCRDGDDDCDGVSDCFDTDCAASSECACTADADCGECLECDVAVGLCRPVDDGGMCWDGAGTCREGACCTGCFDGVACRAGVSGDECGVGGGACVDCPCECADGACALCPSVCPDFPCASGECRDARCCAPAPADPTKVSVSVGRRYACVVDPSGTRCFGEGSRGQLGLGDTNDGSGFVFCDRCPSGVYWDRVATGTTHTCAVRELSGSMVSYPARLACWGSNEAGQLGNSSTGRAVVPTWVATGTSTFTTGAVRDVAVGDVFTCAIVSSYIGSDAAVPASRDAGVDPDEGTVFCWGSGGEGQLGRGTSGTADTLSPMLVSGITASSLTAGRAHACALLERTGALWCWGANNHGQVGAGLGSPVYRPALDARSTWVAIEAGEDHTCGVLEQSDGYWIECWGAFEDGQSPPPQGPFASIPQLALGDAHTCFLVDGRLRCVGRGAAFGHAPADAPDGGLDPGIDAGVGVVVVPVVPSTVPAGRWMEVAAGGGATCVLDEAGALWCAGDLDCPDSHGGCAFARVCLTPSR